MAITADQQGLASDFINESEKNATPALDNGRVPKLENDARISNEFLKRYKVNTTTSFASSIEPDFSLFEQYEATAQDDAVDFDIPLNMDIGRELTISLHMVNDETFTANDDYFFIDTAPTTLEKDYVYIFTIKRFSASGYSISWVRYEYINKSIKYVGSATQIGGTSDTVSLTSLTGGIDTEALEDDVVVVLVSSNNKTTTLSMVTSGYTQLDVQRNSSDTRETASAVFYKVMGSTPDTDAQVSSTAGQYAIIAYVLRGIDTSNPIDVTTLGAVGSNSNNVNSPSITPVTTGAWILSMGGGSSNSNGASVTGSPTGFTNLVERNSQGGNVVVAVAGSKRWQTTDGATDPSAWVIVPGGSSESWSAFTVAIRPANE